MAKKIVPAQVKKLLNPDGQVILPSEARNCPHPLFLRYHREQVYKGD